jgi:hypothetical protein
MANLPAWMWQNVMPYFPWNGAEKTKAMQRGMILYIKAVYLDRCISFACIIFSNTLLFIKLLCVGINCSNNEHTCVFKYFDLESSSVFSQLLNKIVYHIKNWVKYRSQTDALCNGFEYPIIWYSLKLRHFYLNKSLNWHSFFQWKRKV